MISLLPMSGMGSRFAKESYRLPKPFIPIMGMPMFVAAIKSFPPAERLIFICQKVFLERFPFDEEVHRYFPGSLILAVDGVTEGQACSCLVAKGHMDPEESLLISSIDYQFVYDHEAFERLRQDQTIDVAVFTLQTKTILAQDPRGFAYCVTDGDRVTKVVEKQTISSTPELDPAVAGTFYYRRVKDFVAGAESMIQKNIRVNNEFYVGTSINQLIERGLKVVIFPVKKFISFGNPFELQLYQLWEDFFYHETHHPYNGWQK
ncbi:MAG: hypothetical protein HQM16_01695 [Deltaproteobacteria bacterium]|nr:hypothetical protein [Deltaproteobacteria bacterium]